MQTKKIAFLSQFCFFVDFGNWNCSFSYFLCCACFRPAYELEAVFENLDSLVAYLEGEQREQIMAPMKAKLEEKAVGEVYFGNRVHDDLLAWTTLGSIQKRWFLFSITLIVSRLTISYLMEPVICHCTNIFVFLTNFQGLICVYFSAHSLKIEKSGGESLHFNNMHITRNLMWKEWVHQNCVHNKLCYTVEDSWKTMGNVASYQHTFGIHNYPH